MHSVAFGFFFFRSKLRICRRLEKVEERRKRRVEYEKAFWLDEAFNVLSLRVPLISRKYAIPRMYQETCRVA